MRFTFIDRRHLRIGNESYTQLVERAFMSFAMCVYARLRLSTRDYVLLRTATPRRPVGSVKKLFFFYFGYFDCFIPVY